MAQLFIDVIRAHTLAGKFKVHDFVVMRNHVHLLLTVDGTMSIEKAMQLIKGNFSYRAKKELGFMGEIWQRGFSDVRITDEASFSAHQAYIHNNPLPFPQKRNRRRRALFEVDRGWLLSLVRNRVTSFHWPAC